MLVRPNLYDYIKVLALCSMIVDHIWYFFFPENIAYRVVWRYAFPAFLFLVGYNHSYRLRWWLWYRWLFLQLWLLLARYTWYIERSPINILLAIAITRVVLGYVKRYWTIFREVFLFVSSILLVSHTDERIDYGTLSITFALLWYWARMYGKQKKMLVLLFCIVVSYMWYMYIDRWYAMLELMTIIWLLLFLSLGGLSQDNISLRTHYKKRDACILWISNHALVLYVVQALFLVWLSLVIN
jgi:hypothetical protein